MNLREFMEEKFECNLEKLNDDELRDFLYYYDLATYDKEMIKQELCEELEIGEFLMDFINVKELAEYENYTYVNDDCYVCNVGLHYFEICYNEYGKNIEDMINDWRE